MNSYFTIIYWLLIFTSLIYLYRIAVRSYEKDPRLLTTFTVVTHFDGIETYYRSLRGQRLESPPQESSDPSRRALVKKTICKNVLASQFFHMRQQMDVDLEMIFSILMDDYTSIFTAVYSESSRRSSRGSSVGNKYEYDNPYTVRTIRVDDVDEEEHTIVCPALDGPTGRIKEYFVSREYNVNAVARPRSVRIYGRFVFSRRLGEGEDEPLTLVAMAEEPALQISAFLRESLLLEAIYAMTLNNNNNNRPTETPENDPICRLTNANKLRLCAILFGASTFEENKVKFVPILDNVEVDCARKRVVFLSPRSPRHPFVGALIEYVSTDSSRDVHEDWMIGCRGFNDEGEQRLYHVSKGDIENEIFVFQPLTTRVADERVQVYNNYHNVSVVDVERPTSAPRRFLTDDVED